MHVDTLIPEVIAGFHNAILKMSGERRLESWMTAERGEGEGDGRNGLQTGELL